MEKVVMVFAGEYDLACKAKLRTELERIAFLPGLILDLTAVTYMDSTCISEFIRFHKHRAESHLDPETFVLEKPNVQRLFDLLQLGKIFQIANSVVEAIGKGGEAAVEYALKIDGVSHAQTLGTPAPTTRLVG